jgi:ABC-type dipeptide/oligopeptide/nickel transport system permease subunit
MGIGPDPMAGGAPLDAPPPDPEAAVAVAEPGAQRRVAGRSLRQIAWSRLRRDRVAMTGAGIIVILVVVAIVSPLIVDLLGYPPNEWHSDRIDPNTLAPIGTFGGMSWDHLLGVEPLNGRDMFSRVLYGARISLIIAVLATMLSVVIGTVLGVISGYFGGWVDAVISRVMDAFLAFPLLVFAIAIVGVIPNTAFGLSGDALRIAILVFVIGFFSWPYIGRIIRGQTLSLREREFVEAARSLGARWPYIIFREILPNLMAPILIYSTLLVPTNVLFEAALSFLGVGVPPPTATWGGMIAEAVRFYTMPHFMFWPGMAVFITVLAFNLFGDGLRDAFDPKAR